MSSLLSLSLSPPTNGKKSHPSQNSHKVPNPTLPRKIMSVSKSDENETPSLSCRAPRFINRRKGENFGPTPFLQTLTSVSFVAKEELKQMVTSPLVRRPLAAASK